MVLFILYWFEPLQQLFSVEIYDVVYWLKEITMDKLFINYL